MQNYSHLQPKDPHKIRPDTIANCFLLMWKIILNKFYNSKIYKIYRNTLDKIKNFVRRLKQKINDIISKIKEKINQFVAKIKDLKAKLLKWAKNPKTHLYLKKLGIKCLKNLTKFYVIWIIYVDYLSFYYRNGAYETMIRP